MIKLNIHISMGNSKMGAIPNINLPPVVSCRRCGLPCAGTCYAMKDYKRFTSVRKAWDTNWDILNNSITQYFAEVRTFLENDCNMGFRWHVSGDIPSEEYFVEMLKIAKDFPHKTFLCFTKQYEIVNAVLDSGKVLPDNMNLFFSRWNGLPMPNPHNIPEAIFVEIEKEELLYNNLEEKYGLFPHPWEWVCGGNCQQCLSHRRNCYNSRSIIKNYCTPVVYFVEHGTAKANAKKRQQKKSGVEL